MTKNLRKYIDDVRKAAPGELVEVDREVDSNLEATTFLRKLEMAGRAPMAIFNKPRAIDGSTAPTPLLLNAFSTRRKLAMAIDLKPDEEKMELPLALAERFKNLIAPVEIDGPAPVQDVVEKGKDVNLLKYPFPRHNAKDGGPYILGGTVVTKNPESGVYNTAMIRIHIKDKDKGVIHAEPHHHTGMIIKMYHDQGQPAPFAVAIGHHPTFYMGSLWEGPFGMNEYEICGAAMQEPLRLVPSVTWGREFMIPADAEMIIEGYVDPEEIDEEGPIGEHTRYYKTVVDGKVQVVHDPVVKVTAITRRKDAYLQSCNISRAEHGLIGAIPKEAVIYERAKAVCPGVKAVHLTPAGTYRYICYVSLDKRVAGEAKDAIMAAFISDWHIKWAIAVDSDVDIYRDSEVLWAMTFRCKPDKDIFMIPNCMGSPLDPTTDRSRAMVTRVGVDATKPFGLPYSEVCEVDLDLLNKIKIEDYLK